MYVKYVVLSTTVENNINASAVLRKAHETSEMSNNDDGFAVPAQFSAPPGGGMSPPNGIFIFHGEKYFCLFAATERPPHGPPAPTSLFFFWTLSCAFARCACSDKSPAGATF